MPVFDYTAVDSEGKNVKGSLEGADAEQVRDQLKTQGLIPMSVKSQTLLSKDISFGGSGVKARDLALFCKQMNSILLAGVTVIQAMHMITAQTENKALKAALEDATLAVEKGESLANGMRKNENIFPSILINMVTAGESSGSLEIAFERMSIQFEKDAKLKSMMMGAMIYPVAIIIVTIIVVIIMMTVVLPNFKEMFESMDQELPAITLAVIAISNSMTSRWYIYLGVIAAIVVGVKIFVATDAGELLVAKLKLTLPLFGDLTIKSSSATLTRTLSTLLASGLSLVDSIDIVARTVSNRIVRETLFEAKDEVLQGIPLSKPIEASGIFPPMVYQMMSIGEETGNSEEMLDKIADYYEEEVENATKALATAMEPLIIIVLAGVVGSIIGAIMAPMMGMYSAVENA